jgi:hypothetical protein
VVLVPTVTSENVGNMGDLVALGIDVGARQFVFREVSYHPASDVVDHERMPGLLLKPGDFVTIRQTILQRFGASGANFMFADERFLEDSMQKIASDSALL